MKNKLLIILLSGFVISIILTISCHRCGPFPDRYKIIDLDWGISEVEYTSEPFELINVSEINSDFVLFNKFAIYISPVQETYFSLYSQFNSSGFINSAYACSPVEPVTDDRIEKIEIFSDKAYDSDHDTNSNLASLFDVIVVDYNARIYQEMFDLLDFVSTKPTVPQGMTLVLNSPPTETTDFEFTVKYYQNGVSMDYFEFTTDKITIMK